jgi:hypothetical protein
MDLARIALIVAVCLADAILLLWNWNHRVLGRALGRWIEGWAKRMALSIRGNPGVRRGALYRTAGSVRL